MRESLLTADYHVHTDFSDDSRAPMDAVVRRALEIGRASCRERVLRLV